MKQGDEWGDPINCEAGDSCPYCHTRTEQQFHPEIYKSTKCNDIQQTGYCPRGPFCAFAHVEKEISAARDVNMDTTNDLAAILTNALPNTNANGQPNGAVPVNGNSRYPKALTPIASSLPDHYASSFENMSQFATSTQSGMFSPKANEAHVPTTTNGLGPIARPRSYSTSASTHYASANGMHNPLGGNQIGLSNFFGKSTTHDDSTVGSNQRKNSLFSNASNASLFGGLVSGGNGRSNSNLFSNTTYPSGADTVESVVGSALDIEDLVIGDESFHMQGEDKDASQSTMVNGIDDLIVSRTTGMISSATAPVNIPG